MIKSQTHGTLKIAEKLYDEGMQKVKALNQ